LLNLSSILVSAKLGLFFSSLQSNREALWNNADSRKKAIPGRSAIGGRDFQGGFGFPGSSTVASCGQLIGRIPSVDDYATFHGNIEHERKAWQLWPAANRDGNLSPGEFDKNGKQYHLRQCGSVTVETRTK
jgi:hypothetical protein